MLREGDIVFHVVSLLILIFSISHFLLEESTVLRAYSIMDMHHTLAVGIEGAFHKMLLKWCACSVFIGVEEQQSLRKLSVIESLRLKEISHNGFIVAFTHQGFDILTFILLAHSVECRIEGELHDIVEECLLEIRCRNIVICRKECKHILEHTACRTAGRNKFHNLLAFCLVGIPCFGISLYVFCRCSNNAVADACGSIKLQERETCLEFLKLLLYLLF